jgi:ASC-1-like (ASCH) protein
LVDDKKLSTRLVLRKQHQLKPVDLVKFNFKAITVNILESEPVKDHKSIDNIHQQKNEEFQDDPLYAENE